ncbi:MAG: hypothetical protein NPIRA02_21590 [Nitrospirales bacterium]|nr:MAG: hypothetical protein NPIRA02_21590 [Nitrospirales bacterium]
MKNTLIMCIVGGVFIATQAIGNAQGTIPSDYQGMWGAGGCTHAKYYMRIEGHGMHMYAADKQLPLGDWKVPTVHTNGTTLIIDTQETNSQQDTHMELTKLSNGHLTLLLNIGGNGGTDELVGC